jgi:cation diffusion facilitator CzcD-associated flavoprotein CzcO
MNAPSSSSATPATLDVVVVGAGFAGLYAVHRLRNVEGYSVRCFEAEPEVGGTWYMNRYPGARCDVESLDYSYSFSPELQREWVWTERYATQPEILRYLIHVSERFDLRRSIDFDTRVTGMTWDEDAQLWHVETSAGETVTARFCLLAVGSLSTPLTPAIPGLDRFPGEILRTSDWPVGGADLHGKRVAVMGTGSSGIQAIPNIAREAEELWVLQRTPNFSIPAISDALTREEFDEVAANYEERRRQSLTTSNAQPPRNFSPESALLVSDEARKELFDQFWQRGGVQFNKIFVDQMTSKAANDLAAGYVRDKIHEIVEDQAVADALSPTDYPIGAKRICTDTGYYQTFNRPNVHLIDISATPIDRFDGSKVVVADQEIDIDVLVLATGFDAVTGSFMRLDIRGRDGRTLADSWADGAATYLGVGVHGFPNLFLVNGPGSVSVFANMALTSEQGVNWVTDCILWLDAHGYSAIDPEEAPQQRWGIHVNDVAEQTLFPTARSWYTGANVPGKPRQFLIYIGGFATFGTIIDKVAKDDYRGFSLTAAKPALQAAGA